MHHILERSDEGPHLWSFDIFLNCLHLRHYKQPNDFPEMDLWHLTQRFLQLHLRNWSHFLDEGLDDVLNLLREHPSAAPGPRPTEGATGGRGRGTPSGPTQMGSLDRRQLVHHFLQLDLRNWDLLPDIRHLTDEEVLSQDMSHGLDTSMASEASRRLVGFLKLDHRQLTHNFLS